MRQSVDGVVTHVRGQRSRSRTTARRDTVTEPVVMLKAVVMTRVRVSPASVPARPPPSVPSSLSLRPSVGVGERLIAYVSHVSKLLWNVSLTQFLLAAIVSIRLIRSCNRDRSVPSVDSVSTYL